MSTPTPHGSTPHGPTAHDPAPHGSAPHGSAPHGPAPHGPAPRGSAPHSPTAHDPAPQGPSSLGPSSQGPTLHGSTPHGSAPHGPAPHGSAPHGPTAHDRASQGPSSLGPSSQGPTLHGSTSHDPTQDSAPRDSALHDPTQDSAPQDPAPHAPTPHDPSSYETSGQLPVADAAHLRRAARELIRLDLRAFLTLVGLNALAVVAGLAGPWLLGRIVDVIDAGAGASAVDGLALAMGGCALAQLLLTRYARLAGDRFGERTSARVRERFVDRVLALPSSVVERAGTGDVTNRGSNDVASVAVTLRDIGPDVLIATVHALLVLGAVFLVDPLLGLCAVVGLSGIYLPSRWYLRRARSAYLAEGAANSALAELLAATASAARTVEAYGLQQRRVDACGKAIEECGRTRMRTLYLRTVLLPSVDVSYVVPVVGVLAIGGVLLAHDAVSLGAVVACAAYLRQLSAPLDTILQRLEQLQSSSASFARVEGLGQLPPAPEGTTRTPADDRIEVTGVRHAYDGGADVLHGIDLTVRAGERLAVVGPSGAGKSTLGRLLAGIDAPRRGTVTVGGVPIRDLGPDVLRRQVVLITQEHHVFLGTVRDNLLIAAGTATDTELHAALAAVGADWADELPDGLDTELGAGGHHLDGSQAQQLALSRVVLADPHTLILDEATALLDPGTARHTERALAAVLEGRTVIAIAHRLHTAHDADRIAVMDGGRITELGSHEDLVAGGGAYAALWGSWHGES